MSVMYLHFCWFFFIVTMFLCSLFISMYLSFLSCSLYVSIPLFTSSSYSFVFSLYLDWMSTWFITIILLISTMVSFYSYNYIAPYSKPLYFIVLTSIFVLSILLVVTVSDLFFLILGWDGLGIVSFFLIVYYQNQSSITSGIFTLLINRVGDSLFLVSIVLMSYYFSDYFSWSYDSNLLVVVFLVLTFMTNSAIYPFSPWLPMAIAAPTPISALVHSSTLVTAGLYLIIRFSSYLYCSYYLMSVLLVLSIFTSFYAGLNTVFEVDLNNLIALSTLSHLGFIGMAFASGLLHLAFFHILAHALFKSLLFISIGDIIINLNHSQDIRYLSSGSTYTPFSCFIIYVSLFNLLGLPMLSGFYSNDFVLESMNYSNSSSIVLFIIFFNVFFTYYYTYQLFYYSFSSNNLFPFQLFHNPSYFHALLLSVLALSTLLFPICLLNTVYAYTLFLSVPNLFNFFPIFLNLVMFISLLLFLTQFTLNSNLPSMYFSTIMFLSPLIITITSNIYYFSSITFVKSIELGSLNYSFNSYLPSFIQISSKYLISICYLNPMRLILFSVPFLLLYVIFLLSNINLLYVIVTHNIPYWT